MTPWISLPAIALLTGIQMSLVPALDLGPGGPQLVLCWVVGWAVVRGRGEALPWAIFAGLLLDLLSSLPPGVHLLALAAATYLVDTGRRLIGGSPLVFGAVAIVAATALYDLLVVLLLGLAGTRGGLAGLTGPALLGGLYNLLLMFPVVGILTVLDHRFPVPVAPEF